MGKIGIGVIGGGYMGKAHSVAFAAVASVFDTALRPELISICASSPESAERYRKAYGFEKATHDWRELVADPAVEAVVIASPQATHHDIAIAAFALGKPVLCEKPLCVFGAKPRHGGGRRGGRRGQYGGVQLHPNPGQPANPQVCG